jgi:hypothetical protein
MWIINDALKLNVAALETQVTRSFDTSVVFKYRVLIVTQLVKKGPVPCPQEPTAGFYLKTYESSPYPYTIFL